MDKITMAVVEVRELELGVVKQAVESATAGAGVVWEAEANMVDFRLECEDGLLVCVVGVSRV